MKAKVWVTLRRDVLDPAGNAIGHALAALGFEGVSGVRQGKYIELELADRDRAAAEGRVKAMCEQLLANPVIEDYRIEIVDA